MIWIVNATSHPIACPKKGCVDIEPGHVHRDTPDGHVIEENHGS